MKRSGAFCFLSAGHPVSARNWIRSCEPVHRECTSFVGTQVECRRNSLKKRVRTQNVTWTCSARPSESLGIPISEPPESPLSKRLNDGSAALEAALAASPGSPTSLATTLVALFNVASTAVPSSEIFADLLTTNVHWSTPLFSATGLGSVTSNLDGLRNFVIDARVQPINSSNSESEEVVEWLFSFVYPLPWRPRVTISGRSVAFRDTDGTIMRIEDEWNHSPFSIVRQGLPRLQDFIWLWPSPHAETDVGVRRIEKRGRGYDMVTYMSHPEFRTRTSILPQERHAVWSTPCLPESAFIGSIRRKEAYDAVSPIGVRKIDGDFFEWSIPMPGTSFGINIESLKHPDQDSQFVMIPTRRLAVTRFRGFASAPKFLKRRDILIKQLIEDGLLDEEKAKDESRIWSRQYDCKLGYNSLFMPTLSSFGFSQGVPRVNEIAVELDDEFE